MLNVSNIKQLLVDKYKNSEFTTDKTGQKVVEIIGESFLANEPIIFGDENQGYIKRELEWYLSQSLSIDDIPGGAPSIWKQVSSRDGLINSNYGWCIFSDDNGNQYENVIEHLKHDVNTRRGSMIYTRPWMHRDYKLNGMSDFMCTHAVNCFIRNNELMYVVQMRSNDVVFGYKNDYAWHKYVCEKIIQDLSEHYQLSGFKIIWNAASLHIYERHFKYLV